MVLVRISLESTCCLWVQFGFAQQHLKFPGCLILIGKQNWEEKPISFSSHASRFLCHQNITHLVSYARCHDTQPLTCSCGRGHGNGWKIRQLKGLTSTLENAHMTISPGHGGLGSNFQFFQKKKFNQIFLILYCQSKKSTIMSNKIDCSGCHLVTALQPPTWWVSRRKKIHF